MTIAFMARFYRAPLASRRKSLAHSLLRSGDMRRLAAMLSMIAILGLVLLLTWQVQLHRDHRTHDDEPAVVSLDSQGSQRVG
jgi:hypothetical protein